MKMNQAQIRNFRSLYSLQLTLKPITIIIGPNASGKSNLFRALHFLHNTVAADQREWQSDYGQIDNMLWYGYDDQGERPGEIDFSLSLCNQQAESRYSVTFGADEYANVNITHEALSSRNTSTEDLSPYFERDKNEIKQYRGINDRRLKKDVRIEPRSPRVLYMREEGPNSKYPVHHAVYQHIAGWRFVDIDVSLARQESFIPQYPDDIPPLAGNASNLSAFLWALYQKRTDDFETIVDAMADLIELPQKIMLEHDADRGGQTARYGFIEQPFGENRMIPPSSMSDGTIKLLGLLALLLGDRTVSLACLEEPDQGMHPRLMLYLADILRQVAQESAIDTDDYRGPQIIVTTHSPDFMDCFDLAEEKDYLQVYVAWRDETGKTILTPTSAQEFAPWLEKYRLGEAVRRRLI